MKIYALLLFVVLSLFYSCDASRKKENTRDTEQKDQTDFVSKSFDRAAIQLGNAVAQNQDMTKFPRSANPDGTLHTGPVSDWTAGFFPGTLWYMYEYTGDEKWAVQATKWTEALDTVQYDTGSHDVGFVVFCSYGNGLRLKGIKEYEQVIINAAQSLSTRFNAKVSCTKSWDWSDTWRFPVIVDNIMNMELLYNASLLSGDIKYREIANQHALTTMKNHYRDDFSSDHVVDYDPETGGVLEKVTFQGYSDASAWARGQAWGLYGYVFSYRLTQNTTFLSQAKNIADFILKHPNLPKDMVPYWDFDAPNIPDEPRDASAAAIIASSLLELSEYVDDGSAYLNAAERIMHSLSSEEYLAAAGSNNNFILKHCVGHMPANSEVDVPLNYGDYYFLEALLRYKKLKGM